MCVKVECGAVGSEDVSHGLSFRFASAVVAVVAVGVAGVVWLNIAEAGYEVAVQVYAIAV